MLPQKSKCTPHLMIFPIFHISKNKCHLLSPRKPRWSFKIYKSYGAITLLKTPQRQPVIPQMTSKAFKKVNETLCNLSSFLLRFFILGSGSTCFLSTYRICQVCALCLAHKSYFSSLGLCSKIIFSKRIHMAKIDSVVFNSY